MTADELAAAVGNEAAKEMTSARGRIGHCLQQLTDAQIWSRSEESMNSIGNLILHLAGNIRQWIVAGLGNTADTRDRPTEFLERGPIARDELLRRLDVVLDEAKAVLHKQTAANLLAGRRVQTFDVNGLGTIFNSVPHFRGHTQEIIHMTRQLLGEKYQFAGMPPYPAHK